MDVFVHTIPRHSKVPVIRQLQTLANYGATRYELRWPDIVHVHYIYRHRFNIVFAGIKNLIVSTWGKDVIDDEDTLEGRRYDYWRSYILNRAKVITATSEFLADATMRFLADKSRGIKVIPFGVDVDFFKRIDKRPANPEPLNISFIKHLKVKYGPDILIKAFASLKPAESGLKLIMAGEGEMEGELKALVNSSGINDSVEFTGRLTMNEVRDVLERTDIFVQPSVYQSESFGVAAVEAQTMEIPVIATRVGGVPEVVKDGVTGFLVDAGNIDALASKMATLAAEPALRLKLGEAGREYVLQKYDWRENAKMMEEVYREVLGW